VNIDLLSQRRETTPFCYSPVMAEVLLSAVPSYPLVGGLLIPIRCGYPTCPESLPCYLPT